MNDNNLITLGLDLNATKAKINNQLSQIVKDISNSDSLKLVAGLNVSESQKRIQQQLDSIKDLKVNVQVDTSQTKKQAKTALNTSTTKDNAQYTNSAKTAIVEQQKLAKQFKNVRTEVQATNTASTSFFGNLKQGVGDALQNLLRYQLSYKIIQTTTEALKDMVVQVTALDKSLTEFNKVADLSQNQLSDFADKAYNLASQIGRSGQDMIDAATEFKRAGYDLEQSLDLGNSALVMTNVADGISTTADAAGTLISVLKGFNMSDSEALSIVDKMNSVSNQSPVGFDNLADGLERVSGTMEQAGNSIDQTIGILTGGFAQLRNMEKVSTGLITISQRLRGIIEDGEADDGLVPSLEKAFGDVGVQIEDTNGELRSTYDILSDYAKIYPTLTSEQQQYLGELAAGKRQITVFNAIIKQMQDVDNAINQSIDSEGSAIRENEIYRKSIEGLKNEYNNAFQELSNTVIDSDWIKDLVSAATDFLHILTNIIKQDDIIGDTISIATKGLKGIASILEQITGNDIVGKLIKTIMSIKTLQGAGGILGILQGKEPTTTKNGSLGKHLICFNFLNMPSFS